MALMVASNKLFSKRDLQWIARDKRCLFCCFIGLLGPENQSSESWERQHFVGTGKGAYLQNPPKPLPPAKTSPWPWQVGRGVWVSICSPRWAPGKRPWSSRAVLKGRRERFVYCLHLSCASSCAWVPGRPWVRRQAACSAAAYHTREEPFGVQAVSQSRWSTRVMIQALGTQVAQIGSREFFRGHSANICRASLGTYKPHRRTSFGTIEPRLLVDTEHGKELKVGQDLRRPPGPVLLPSDRSLFA